MHMSLVCRHSSQIDELEHQRRASSTSMDEPDNGLSSQQSLEAALLPSTQNIENVPARQADIRSSGGSLSCFGLSLYSSQIVLQLSGLVALDSFGGSLISGAHLFASLCVHVSWSTWQALTRVITTCIGMQVLCWHTTLQRHTRCRQHIWVVCSLLQMCLPAWAHLAQGKYAICHICMDNIQAPLGIVCNNVACADLLTGGLPPMSN